MITSSSPLPRRGVLALAGAGAVGLGLAACSGPSTTAGETGGAEQAKTDWSGVTPADTVTVWTNHPGKSQAVEEEFLARFAKTNPDITVEFVTAGANYDEISQKFQAALTGSDLPDLVLLSDVWWFRYALNGQLAPLGDLLPAAGVDVGNYQPGLLADYQYDDQQWAVPYCRSTPVFYYNKAHWAAAGLPDRGPETWSEFEQWLPKLQAAGTGAQAPYGLGKGTGNASWIHQNLIWGRGGALSEDWTMTVDSPEVLEASDYLRSFITRGWAAVSSSDQASDFGAGLYSSVIGSTGSLSGILAGAAFDVGNAFLPGGPAGRFTPTGGAGFAVPTKRSPEQQLAAATFLKFLAEDDNTAYFSQNTGYMPVTTGAVDSGPMQEVYAQTPLFKTAVDQLANVRKQDNARVFVPGGDQSTVTAWEKVMLQGAPSAEAWGTAQDEIQRSYETDVAPLVKA
ncbi:ABC transporter substrate-binding protein [Kineococcus radiotolerans]|uniref:Extracellular solute-binding protein family 1 n=1 Tax=Kineococcus radiotolerans (strain ATCC BAA-149 / DSM 14245 / SRS30216) TaxID=266940 RepID=A6W4P8_KINRD|nr:ABC transporter substrate-binding protein [Kineococcus radiotolerans]ABS01787.1 extracellular solute-binding protein family 1 [Kineococcus radiotolerans SRS30216 = ATCC BAA-149]